jgi:hypothetical protein
MSLLKLVARDQLRLLSFREFKPNLREHWAAYLAWGLLWTWIAGMGRYWDNPRAEWWQTLGLGSLAYVFSLSFVLWVLIAPLGPRNWSYRTVLIFVTLTSLPAVLYAIPVELFMEMAAAQRVNLIFLLVVATWRVALLWVFLRRVAQLRGLVIFVACLLPLALIVVSLAALNLEHVVFNIMAGNGTQSHSSSNDAAYSAIFGLTMLSFITSPIMAVLYVAFVITEWLRRRAERSAASIHKVNTSEPGADDQGR